MKKTIDAKIISSQEGFIVSLAELENEILEKNKPDELEIELEEPQVITGAIESWYELAVAIGVFSLPLSVLGGILANWIWSSYKSEQIKEEDSNSKKQVKVVLSSGENEKTAEVEVNFATKEDLEEALLSALYHVNKNE